MNVEQIIKNTVSEAIAQLYQKEVTPQKINLKKIPKNLEGDFSVVTFPFAKMLGKNPQQIAEEIGNYLVENSSNIAKAEAIKGFCNLSIGDGYWLNFLKDMLNTEHFGKQASNGQTVVVEYSSPNTNKPLHLGHIRNNLLGYSTAQLLTEAGYTVKKVQIVNDRGIHICKSMIAWQRFGQGETPQSSGMKGDHLVGKYYVQFEKAFQEEYAAWKLTEEATACYDKWAADEKAFKKTVKTLEKKGKDTDTDALKVHFFKSIFKNQYFNNHSALGNDTKEMLLKWEAEDEEIRQLWSMMNGWVYKGFEKTYDRLGVNFDKLYYESNTYLTGRTVVEENLASDKPVFFHKEDGSTWIDLKDVKLDEKVVLRKDGTTMYITQDIGTASLRHQDFNMDKMVYVVGNEQDYHFKVLFEILKRLGYDFAKDCFHLSYGMVNLTTGKMKSREGTVVDADDLMADIIENVRQESLDRSTLEGLSTEEQAKIWEQVALGALKFYILKVEPKKSMIFDPQQSIDLQGQTGPYIQNAYVRTQAVQRKFHSKEWSLANFDSYELKDSERDILLLVHEYPSLVQHAAKNYNPGEVANYLYDLAKAYHKFWNDVYILDEADMSGTSFRIELSKAVATTIQRAGALLGMEMPSRM